MQEVQYVILLLKLINPAVQYVNNCIFYIKSDNFKFNLEETIMAFVYGNVNIFHKINLLQKILKKYSKHK